MGKVNLYGFLANELIGDSIISCASFALAVVTYSFSITHENLVAFLFSGVLLFFSILSFLSGLYWANVVIRGKLIKSMVLEMEVPSQLKLRIDLQSTDHGKILFFVKNVSPNLLSGSILLTFIKDRCVVSSLELCNPPSYTAINGKQYWSKKIAKKYPIFTNFKEAPHGEYEVDIKLNWIHENSYIHKFVPNDKKIEADILIFRV